MGEIIDQKELEELQQIDPKKLGEGIKKYLEEYKIDLNEFNPSIIGDEDETRLKEVASAWKNNEAGIRAVINNRIQGLRDYIITECDPYEFIPRKLQLLVLIALIGDFQANTAELEERVKQSKENPEEDTEEVTEEVTEEQSQEDNSSI